MVAWLAWMGRRFEPRHAIPLALAVATGGCLGIEGTDVSTGATGASAGESTDAGGDSFTGPATDPSGTMTTTAGDPSTDTADEGVTTDPQLDVGNDSDATTGTLGESSSGSETQGVTSGTGGSTGTDDGASGTDTGTGTDTSTGTGTDTGQMCGDGEIQLGEDCEGPDVQGETCISLGYAGGRLACDPDSCLFDVTACV